MTDVLKAYYVMSGVTRRAVEVVGGRVRERERAVTVKQDCFLLKDLLLFQNNTGTFRQERPHRKSKAR